MIKIRLIFGIYTIADFCYNECDITNILNKQKEVFAMNKKIAVIGCGRIAINAHFPALAGIEGVKVKYACDILIEKAQAMKDKYPELIDEVITDYKIALADPEIDAVFVLTPNYAHYTITMDALKAGKHVFCEKPITINYALSCEMAEEAKKQNKLLNIGVVNRYNEAVEKLAEMNANGEFGKIYHVYCSFRRHRGIPGLGGDFTTKSQSGGGVLIDCGIHYFDLIFYILGNAKILNVTADTYSEMAKDIRSYKYEYMWAEETMNPDGINDVEDFITGYVRTDKASISFNGSWAENNGESECYIDFLGDKKGARLTYGGQFKLYDGETLESTVSEIKMNDMFQNENRAFLEATDSGEKTKTYIDNILETMKLLETLYKSAEDRREITFEKQFFGGLK